MRIFPKSIRAEVDQSENEGNDKQTLKKFRIYNNRIIHSIRHNTKPIVPI